MGDYSFISDNKSQVKIQAFKKYIYIYIYIYIYKENLYRIYVTNEHKGNEPITVNTQVKIPEQFGIKKTK